VSPAGTGAGEDSGTDPVPGQDPLGEPGDLGDIVIPDDLSALEGDATVAIVVTQVASAQALAAAGALNGLAIDAVDSPVGALAVCRSLSGDGPARVAAALSTVVAGVPVILLERREGQISACRWLNGEPGEDLPPGLVLGDAPEVLEDLLLGTVTVADLPGVVTSVGLSRWRAMRILASRARSTRRSEG
jgi:hypothetical protein